MAPRGVFWRFLTNFWQIFINLSFFGSLVGLTKKVWSQQRCILFSWIIIYKKVLGTPGHPRAVRGSSCNKFRRFFFPLKSEWKSLLYGASYNDYDSKLLNTWEYPLSSNIKKWELTWEYTSDFSNERLGSGSQGDVSGVTIKTSHQFRGFLSRWSDCICLMSVYLS